MLNSEELSCLLPWSRLQDGSEPFLLLPPSLQLPARSSTCPTLKICYIEYVEMIHVEMIEDLLEYEEMFHLATS